jgi:hypothetical protein
VAAMCSNLYHLKNENTDSTQRFNREIREGDKDMKGKMDGEKEVKDEDTREIIC